jgi:CheY-like chemotaxis protein
MTDPAVILVVEDNQDNQLLAFLILERDGYRVDLAATAAEALQRISARTPDIILMDIRLGGEDGIELARRLKADPATAMIPIVALTALAMAGDKLQMLAAGCVGYVSKPIDTRTFSAQIRRYLTPSRSL